MKIITIAITLICFQQAAFSQEKENNGTDLSSKYKSSSYLKLVDNYTSTRKFINLHIVRTFPKLYADAKPAIASANETELFDYNLIFHTHGLLPENKKALQNIKWAMSEE